MLNLSKKLVILTSVVSVGHGIVNSAMGMENPRDNMRIDRSNEPNNYITFIKGTDLRVFMITDRNDPGIYASYPTTENNEYLTIQNVPGDGRCADFALGISRDEFIRKFEIALNDDAINEKNIAIKKYNDSWHKPMERLKENTYEFLDYNTLSSIEGSKNEIGSLVQLSACLYGLNLEIYIPEPSSVGEDFFIGDRKFKPINALKLYYKISYGDSQEPVIRLLHMGENKKDDYRRENLHFRCLYNKEQMQLWEKNKINLLKDACTSKGWEREQLEIKIAQIQEEGLKNSPIDVTQVNNSYQELLAEHISGYVKAGFSNEDLMNMLRDNGVGDDITVCNRIIELAKIKASGSDNQEAARQEAAHQEAARQEAARQEAARQEAARQEAARQEAARQEAARQRTANEIALVVLDIKFFITDVFYMNGKSKDEQYTTLKQNCPQFSEEDIITALYGD